MWRIGAKSQKIPSDSWTEKTSKSAQFRVISPRPSENTQGEMESCKWSKIKKSENCSELLRPHASKAQTLRDPSSPRGTCTCTIEWTDAASLELWRCWKLCTLSVIVYRVQYPISRILYPISYIQHFAWRSRDIENPISYILYPKSYILYPIS